MLVVDASAITELLLGRPSAAAVAEQLAAHDHDMHAPDLLDIEVLSALRRLVATGEAGPERAEAAVVDLLDLSLARYAHDILVPRIWSLRANFSAYDAAYVALAEALSDEGVPLLTTDGKLGRAVRAHTDLAVLTG
jgi:predicted nucleic acid-binding protein